MASLVASADSLERLPLRTETPHTERARGSSNAIQMQKKLTAIGEPRRSELLKQQIEAFQQKVKQCEEAYSSALAEQMLSQITLTDGSFIDSVYKLKQFVQNISSQQQNTPPAIYASWYISNMTYLKGLKTNFDERIYVSLTSLYQRKNQVDETNASAEGSKESTTLSDVRAPSAASVLKFKNDLPEVSDLYDFTEVENIASRLKYIRQRWQLLLDDESETSSTLFSYQSVVKTGLQCPRQIVNLLRLVPDILLKCRKAGLLAQQWLECASSKAIDLHVKYSKLERVKSVLTEKLSGLNEEIKSKEKKLEATSTDLELLADREERANEILSQTQQLDNNIKQLEINIRQRNFRNDELQQIKNSTTDRTEKQETQKKIYRNELEVLRLEQEIRLLVFEKGLLEEDLTVELEVKPTMIRFTDQIQERCENLEQAIDNKRLEKQRVESALVPVIADRNRTQAKISGS